MLDLQRQQQRHAETVAAEAQRAADADAAVADAAAAEAAQTVDELSSDDDDLIHTRIFG